MLNFAVILGRPSSFSNSIQENKVPMYEMHSDLDDALAKLQQILANNFTLDGNVVVLFARL